MESPRRHDHGKAGQAHDHRMRRRGSQTTDEVQSVKKEYLYKLLVVGNMGTGKTSIIKRYCDDEFSDAYKTTIGVDFALKSVDRGNGKMVHLQLWDIAGQERYGNLTRVYYRDAVGGFVVFDISRDLQESLEIVKKWKSDVDSKIRWKNGDALPVVLLANKMDLVGEEEITAEKERLLDEFIRENSFLGWFFTSAKENMNIEEAMNLLIEHIVENYQHASVKETSDAMHLTLNESEIQKYGGDASVCC